MPTLARNIHEASTAAVDPGMSAAYACFLCARSVGLLDVLVEACSFAARTTAEPSVARLASIPVYTASPQTFMNNAG
jgi:hypothetical protein